MKATCLRAFAEVGALGTQTGFMVRLQLPEQRSAAYVHEPAPWCTCVWLCRRHSRGPRLLGQRPPVPGEAFASQGQNESVLEQGKANESIFVSVNILFVIAWVFCFWSFFGKMKSWQAQFHPSVFLSCYWSVQSESLRNGHLTV